MTPKKQNRCKDQIHLPKQQLRRLMMTLILKGIIELNGSSTKGRNVMFNIGIRESMNQYCMLDQQTFKTLLLSRNILILSQIWVAATSSISGTKCPFAYQLQGLWFRVFVIILCWLWIVWGLKNQLEMIVSPQYINKKIILLIVRLKESDKLESADGNGKRQASLPNVYVL